MKSIERAGELMYTRRSDLPKKALDYLHYFCRSIACGEMAVTALAHYAEIVEGCEKSPGYEADYKARLFFSDYSE